MQLDRGAVEIDRLPRGAPGALAWPWDQGLTVEFIRDIPHQSRTNITEQFRSINHFPFGRCLQVMADRGFTMLARVQPRT